jgi:enoyl-CoA hydratase/carnithine racemase
VPKPVIAAVEALPRAAASGCLACDLIVAAEDAKFVMSYVKVGLSPDGGGSDSLAHALPPQAALELLLDGRRGAARLHALGVVNRVVARGAPSPRLAWAERLAQGRAGPGADQRLVYAASRARPARRSSTPSATRSSRALPRRMRRRHRRLPRQARDAVRALTSIAAPSPRDLP